MWHSFKLVEDDFYPDSHTMRTTTGGYDGQREGDGDSDSEATSFTLERDEQGYSAKFVCVLRRNGMASGIIYLENEEEYQWLRERVNGVFSRGD